MCAEKNAYATTWPCKTGKSDVCVRPQHGFTLVELVISIVILGIVSVGLMATQASIANSSADPMLSRQSQAIAEAYINEIVARNYLDPSTGTVCPSAPASRNLYDNVCDYAGLPDTVVRDEFGTDLGFTGYSVSVTVTPSATLNGLPSADVLLAHVVVTDPQGQTSSLSAYRTRY